MVYQIINVGFNDSLLLLSKMVNQKEFLKCLETLTDECLNSDKKTTTNRCFGQWKI